MIFKNPINKLKEIKDNIYELGGILNEGKDALLSPFTELEQETIAKFTNDLNMTEDEQLAYKKIKMLSMKKCGMEVSL